MITLRPVCLFRIFSFFILLKIIHFKLCASVVESQELCQFMLVVVVDSMYHLLVVICRYR